MQVLQDLVGDKALQRFRVEYEKLFRVLKKSHGAFVLPQIVLGHHETVIARAAWC